jgi:membrane protein DedA with SNARE-associated domain
MKKFNQGIKKFMDDLTFIISFFLLTLTYFFGVALTFLFAKIFGKSFLDNKKKESYWRNLNLKEKPMEDYYKQF